MWGDPWSKKYGKDLIDAGTWISTELKRRTWCTLVWKEKYGTLRYEHVICPGGSVYFLKNGFSLPLWLFPVRTQHGTYPRAWYWSSSKLAQYWQSRAWHTLWKIIQEATVKWPHIEEELVEDIASDEDIVGKEVHKQYWR